MGKKEGGRTFGKEKDISKYSITKSHKQRKGKQKSIAAKLRLSHTGKPVICFHWGKETVPSVALKNSLNKSCCTTVYKAGKSCVMKTKERGWASLNN